jgi:hypothetical protein
LIADYQSFLRKGTDAVNDYRNPSSTPRRSRRRTACWSA